MLVALRRHVRKLLALKKDGIIIIEGEEQEQRTVVYRGKNKEDVCVALIA